jgi:exonuclease III
MLSWNIRQGGGRRLGDIVAAINGYSPDVVVLNEVRARTASTLCAQLSDAGLAFREHTNPARFESGTLVAARTPLRRLPRRGPSKLLQHGLLEVELANECVIGAVYGPMVTPKHRPFWNRLVRHATANVSASYLLIGDFNTCEAGVDAYKKPLAGSDQFVAIRDAGYVDLWRRTNSTMEYTWFSFGRGGVTLNGFRIDHALASPSLANRVTGCRYAHVERENRLSDHSLLVLHVQT